MPGRRLQEDRRLLARVVALQLGAAQRLLRDGRAAAANGRDLHRFQRVRSARTRRVGGERVRARVQRVRASRLRQRGVKAEGESEYQHGVLRMCRVSRERSAPAKEGGNWAHGPQLATRLHQ